MTERHCAHLVPSHVAQVIRATRHILGPMASFPLGRLHKAGIRDTSGEVIVFADLPPGWRD